MHRVWFLASLWSVAVTVIAETTTTALPPCDVNGSEYAVLTFEKLAFELPWFVLRTIVKGNNPAN